MNKFKIGDRVKVTHGNNTRHSQGIVRFIGEIESKDGQWIGIELDQSHDGNYYGNNDGSVNNTRYFECKPSAGVFVSATAITAISQQKSGTPTGQRSTPTSSKHNVALSATKFARTRTEFSRSKIPNTVNPPVPDYFNFILPDKEEISIKTRGCTSINDLRKSIIQELNVFYGPHYTTENNIHPVNIHICHVDSVTAIKGSVSINEFW
ncbi:hypothetical protein HK100_008450, partial [Physocladia obscura]